METPKKMVHLNNFKRKSGRSCLFGRYEIGIHWSWSSETKRVYNKSKSLLGGLQNGRTTKPLLPDSMDDQRRRSNVWSLFRGLKLKSRIRERYLSPVSERP